MFFQVRSWIKPEIHDDIGELDVIEHGDVSLVRLCHRWENPFSPPNSISLHGMGGMTVDELFNIANMAKKYQIDALKESVKKGLEAYPLDENNVVICASHAREYRQFEELSKALLLHCTKFLKSVVVKAEDYDMFAAKYCDSDLGKTAIKLLGMSLKLLQCRQPREVRKTRPRKRDDW